MKKTLIILSIVLIASFVSANYGGEDILVMSFDKCSTMTINVEATNIIDGGEYIFKDCTYLGDNSWDCACFDGYELIMETKYNTFNDYTINIIYSYEENVEDTTKTVSSGGGGGGGSSKSSWTICEDWSECVNGQSIQYCYDSKNSNINYKLYKECTPEITQPTEENSEEQEKNPEETGEETTTTQPTGLLGITGGAVTDFLKKTPTIIGIISTLVIISGFGVYRIAFRKN